MGAVMELEGCGDKRAVKYFTPGFNGKFHDCVFNSEIVQLVLLR